MLQAEEIDDDYFTPASSTSLANIFGKSNNDKKAENESLKYIPPKPTNTSPKPEDTKPTQCIFACALLGYEWSNGAYIPKGKLGFAIVKIIKTGFHNIVLYDTDKVTLSCVTISTNFEVTIKNDVYLQYQDNLNKFWSLYASEEEMIKITDLFKSLNVSMKYLSDLPGDNNPSEPLKESSAMKEQTNIVEKESDTDSSINRKTKQSILNRMASMGQSVLPPRAVTAEKSSDSSDTAETSHYKTVRHKPIKSSVKRNSSEKNIMECQSLVEPEKISACTEHSAASIPLFTYVNGQLVPVTTSNLVTSSSSTSGNDMGFFISEQRVSNSELRINMNRLTDKVDQILNHVTDGKHRDSHSGSSTFQIEIFQKLLAEYENKIKVYEEFIKCKGMDKNFVFNATGDQLTSNIIQQENELTDKVLKLEQRCYEKDITISNMQSELKLLQAKFSTEMNTEKINNVKLCDELESLKKEVDIKDELINKTKTFVNQSLNENEDEDSIQNKIKNIMNDTFRAFVANFENNESYTGDRVKNVAAAVIKRVTIESLNTI